MYPAEGDVVEGKYRIDRLLGEGGMGAVFCATHLIRRAPVALKFMSPTAAAMAESVDRFRNEAVAASDIDSAHVVKIYDVGQWGELPYLVMELLNGHDLAVDIAQAEQQRQYLEVPRAVHFTLQILRALQAAHGKGIVHRDLKPANAFVINNDGEPDFVKLVDFGISKKREGDGVHLTRTNVTMGTPLYMSPEQARSAKDADARSDLYSVAAILYELLCLQPPFPADDLTALIAKLLMEEPTPPHTLRPDVPPALSAVVVRGLAKAPTARYQTAAEFAEALSPFADQRSAQLLRRLTALDTGRYTTAPTIAVSSPSTYGPSNTAVAFGTGTGPSLDAPKRSPFAGVAIGALLATAAIGGVAFVAAGRSKSESHGAAAAAVSTNTPEKPAIESAPKVETIAPEVAVSASSSASAESAKKPPPHAAGAVVPAPLAIKTGPSFGAPRASSAPPVGAPAKPPEVIVAPTPTAKATSGSTLKTMRPDD
ncbi:MAG: protein kinase [Polyangiales bacterium]